MKPQILKFAFLALSACGAANQGPAVTLMFGAVTDQSGSLANTTTPMAIDMAVTDFNTALSKSKYASLKFKATVQDSTNNIAVAVPRAISAVKDGAIAVLTDGSSDTIWTNALNYGYDAGSPLGVPLLSTEASTPLVNNPSVTLAQANNNPVLLASLHDKEHWVFRVAPPASSEGLVAVRIALTYGNKGDVNSDGKFVANLYSTDEAAGLGVITAFLAGAQELAPNAETKLVKVSTSVNPATYDFGPDLQQLTQGAPDVLLTTGLPTYQIGLTRAAVQAQTPVRFIHEHAFYYPQVLQSLGTQANGHEGATLVVAATSASGDTFVKRMKEEKGVETLLYVSQHYDASALIMLASVWAIHKHQLTDFSQVTGLLVKEGLSQLNNPQGTKIGIGSEEFAKAINLLSEGKPINFDGASGPCDFDANQNVETDVLHYVVENGAYKTLAIYGCSTDRTCPFLK